MKVAIVHDWLVTYAGAERVLEEMLVVYPQADLFAVVDFIPEAERGFLQNKKSTTSFIQKLPFARKGYRYYLPLMPLAIEQLDVTGYDLVISSSHAVAKGVITGPDQRHVCMCYSPIRYAWDLQHQYLKGKGLLARVIMHKMRMWDVRTSNGVDQFIAISHFIAKRIHKVYRRDSKVIYPPVDLEGFDCKYDKENFYLTASRMVPYKKIDLIVEAFAAMLDKQLFVIGDGPDFAKIKKKAGKNVHLMGFQPQAVLREMMQRAKAFVFAAKEDFGIAPLEAQACGTPVIGFGEGALLETIVDGVTGCFFDEQSVASIVLAVNRFENLMIDPNKCRENAMRFSKERFRRELIECVR